MASLFEWLNVHLAETTSGPGIAKSGERVLIHLSDISSITSKVGNRDREGDWKRMSFAVIHMRSGEEHFVFMEYQELVRLLAPLKILDKTTSDPKDS